MKESTAGEYITSPYAKSMFVSEAKAGKTTWLVGQLLGVWPGQKSGGVVSTPDALHIITFDVKALKGTIDFLKKYCNAPAAIDQVHVLNMEEDIRNLTENDTDWDYTLYNEVRNAIGIAQNKMKTGTHALLVSSITGLSQGIQRALFGRPGLGDKKGMGGDRAKWPAYSSQLAELRNFAQQDYGHCFWEGHIDKVSTGTSGNEETKDSIGLQGAAGRNFAYNVGEVFRLRRMVGQFCEGSKVVGKMSIDTKPDLSFFQGRDFSELNPTEYDLTSVLYRLKYKVGCWGRPSKAAK